MDVFCLLAVRSSTAVLKSWTKLKMYLIDAYYRVIVGFILMSPYFCLYPVELLYGEVGFPYIVNNLLQCSEYPAPLKFKTFHIMILNVYFKMA